MEYNARDEKGFQEEKRCHKVFEEGSGDKNILVKKVLEKLSQWYQNVAFPEWSLMQVITKVSRRKSVSQGFRGGRRG